MTSKFCGDKSTPESSGHYKVLGANPSNCLARIFAFSGIDTFSIGHQVLPFEIRRPSMHAVLNTCRTISSVIYVGGNCHLFTPGIHTLIPTPSLPPNPDHVLSYRNTNFRPTFAIHPVSRETVPLINPSPCYSDSFQRTDFDFPK